MNYSSLLIILLIPLGAGEIPDLFSDEDVDKIISGIRNEVRGLGMVDSVENCWKFFFRPSAATTQSKKHLLSLHLVRRCCFNSDMVLSGNSYDKFEFHSYIL